MTYMGTEAYDLDASRGAFAPQGARSFETIEGAGLDARERAGVSRQVLSTLKVLAAIAAVFMVLSAARVGVFTYAATILSQNSTMRSELKEARSLQDDLRVQRSVLSSASRIDRIATQSYGMVLAGDPVKLAAGDAEAAAAAEAEAENSASADAQETSASTAASPEEVASQLGQANITQGDGSTAGANAVDVDSIA
ncbi:MAG: hypothetical protein SOX20_04885 [Parolsenella sp.]|uniref:hypothetical protein n=1 Tax=unclassified Parolsenella TaxID=2623992 RepID=UPI002A75BD92|nr:hypothetical protein [Parolsenella sp.]MCI5949081.1 hypothetical protein [Coriobacteriaceae bacterium]MDY3292242.1 hypothetical protein [Parolsenella sp.]